VAIAVALPFAPPSAADTAGAAGATHRTAGPTVPASSSEHDPGPRVLGYRAAAKLCSIVDLTALADIGQPGQPLELSAGGTMLCRIVLRAGDADTAWFTIDAKIHADPAAARQAFDTQRSEQRSPTLQVPGVGTAAFATPGALAQTVYSYHGNLTIDVGVLLFLRPTTGPLPGTLLPRLITMCTAAMLRLRS